MEEFAIGNSRQQDIMNLLEENNSLTVKDIANKLGVSLVTVRRDLAILQKYNMVNKFHGGVSLNRSDTPQSLFDLSLEMNKDEKRAIAKVASTLIKERNVVGIDASSTAYYIADYTSALSSFSVITYALIPALRFSSNPHINVFQLGGNINNIGACITDHYAISACKQFHTDITFFSNHAINTKRGCFDSTVSIEIKKSLISIADRAVLLADSSKFDKTAMCLSVPFEDIDTIITDEKISDVAVKNLLKHNIELYISKIDDGSVLEHFK